MKSILIISCVFPPEPVVSASLSFDIASELAKDYNVSVISPKPTRPFGYAFNNVQKQQFGFKHASLNSFTYPKSSFLGRFIESFSFGIYSFKYIKSNRNEIDLIYLNTWPIFSQFFVLLAAKKYGIRAVTHIQDIYPESFLQKLPKWLSKILGYIFFPIEHYIIENSYHIITISRGMMKHLTRTRNITPDKISVIYNWQDEQKFIIPISSNKTNNSQFVFMFLGSISPTANLNKLLDAFIQINDQNIKLIIAGQGSDKSSLQNKVKQASKLNIEFIDAPSDQAGIIQNKADVLILSLVSNGAQFALPSKLCSYMFSAKPIIATVDNDSDIANILINSESGFVSKPDNIQDLIQKILHVKSLNRDQLVNMGMRGRKYALEHFSKNVNIRKITTKISESFTNDY